MVLGQLLDKLHESCGETLVEVLAAILVAALSVALLFSCVMASTEMNRSAGEMRESNVAGVNAAESQESANLSEGKVAVAVDGSSKDVKVKLYGKNGVYSYSY